MKPSVLLAIAALAACASTDNAYLESPGSIDLVIENVTVIDTAKGTLSNNRTVVVSGGKIIDVRANGKTANAQRTIDGTGRYLLPALADMHVHIRSEDHLPMYVANGVTLVREMWGSPARLSMREQAQSNPAWPTLVVGSPAIDGDPPTFPDSPAASDPAQARALVQNLAQAGYDFIKVYDQLDIERLMAIVEESQSQGIPTAGHAPFGIPIRKTLDSGMASLEHGQLYLFEYLAEDVALPEAPFQPQTHFPAVMMAAAQAMQEDGSIDSIFDAAKRAAFAEEVAESGVWSTPTMIALINTNTPSNERDALLSSPEYAAVGKSTMKSWGEDNYRFQMFSDQQLIMLRALGRSFGAFIADLDKAGGRILIGTDAPEAFIVPGVSMHEEMAYLVDAGLSPARVLKAATVDAATFLGLDNWGRIEPTMEADMILLENNPLTNIRATRSIVGVVNDGQWMASAPGDEHAAPLNTQWPGKTPELFAPGVVNTDGIEINLVFNNDYSEVYFARRIDGVFFVYFSRLMGGEWTQPQPLDLLPGGDAVDMALSPDEQSLYFLGIVPDGDARQRDIWVSKRQGSHWSRAEKLGPSINTEHSEFYPTVVADGSVYFVGEKPHDFGPRNLYRAALKADGEFEPAIPVGLPIDTEHVKGDTFVAPDESYIIFSSNARGGFGSSDLFIAYATDDGWTEPKNMGAIINTDDIEFCPMVSPDGRWLSFSRRFGTTWETTSDAAVYWMDASIIEELRED